MLAGDERMNRADLVVEIGAARVFSRQFALLQGQDLAIAGGKVEGSSLL